MQATGAALDSRGTLEPIVGPLRLLALAKCNPAGFLETAVFL